MTIPGAGGQVPPRPDQAGIAQAGGLPQGVVVAPGGKPVSKVTQLIVEPGGVLQGIFTYSSNPPAAGTLIESASVQAAGTDQFGNNFVAGHASYSSTTAIALTSGGITFYTGSLAGGWTPAATMQFFSGFILMSTGLETQNNVLDDGTGNCSVLGTMTVQGTSLSIGNGVTADLFLSPKIATPPNLAAVIAQTATLAQTQACLGGIVQSFQNRGMVN
ncbi:MAG TPA: hypothetical protein VK284_09435 [Streptosporangiaceae bacterium]|nr:hypothetical protein [Streptosporangiaceae bacterium]